MFLPHPLLAPLRATQRGRVRFWLLLLLIAVGVAALAWWKLRAPASVPAGPGASAPASAASRFAGGAAQPVTVGTVQRQDLRVQVSAIGTVTARATAVVRARVSGELRALRFKEGQEVKAGQLLAEIDARSYQATLAQAQGTLARDQAQLKNAQIDLQRYRDLQAKDSIAAQQVDTQAALVRQLEGTVAAGKAAADAARLNVDYTRITAPISGRLGLRGADVGNVVGPGDANGIVTITQVQPIDVVFAVPQAHVARISRRLGEGAELPVELWSSDGQRSLARGRVAAVDNAIDVATGTIKVKAAFTNDDRRLFPNQFANVKMTVDVVEGALTLPQAALQNNAVYVVQEGGTVARRAVRVGVTDGDRVSVQGELEPGQQVVTDGLDRLRDGGRVTVIDGTAAQKADAAAANRQDPAARMRAAMEKLSPEQRAKVEKMGPEERRAFFRELRAKQGAASAAGASSASAPAAPAALAASR